MEIGTAIADIEEWMGSAKSGRERMCANEGCVPQVINKQEKEDIA